MVLAGLLGCGGDDPAGPGPGSAGTGGGAAGAGAGTDGGEAGSSGGSTAAAGAGAAGTTPGTAGSTGAAAGSAGSAAGTSGGAGTGGSVGVTAVPGQKCGEISAVDKMPLCMGMKPQYPSTGPTCYPGGPTPGVTCQFGACAAVYIGNSENEWRCPEPKGGDCTNYGLGANPCATGLSCDQNKCIAPTGAGGSSGSGGTGPACYDLGTPCAVDSQCCQGLACRGRCSPPTQPDGGTCQIDLDCKSGHCWGDLGASANTCHPAAMPTPSANDCIGQTCIGLGTIGCGKYNQLSCINGGYEVGCASSADCGNAFVAGTCQLLSPGSSVYICK